MARIVLAEDDDNLRFFLARALRRAGHEVSDYPDGDAALTWMGEHAVDLLLADVPVLPTRLREFLPDLVAGRLPAEPVDIGLPGRQL